MIRSASTPDALLAGLSLLHPDVIVADLEATLPPGEAMELCRTFMPDTPFIVMGQANEESRAVDLLERGAADYVPATQGARLGSAVRRAVERARERRALRHQRAQEELTLRILPLVFYRARLSDGRVLWISDQVEKLTGFPRDEWISSRGLFLERLHPEDAGRRTLDMRTLLSNGASAIEYRWRVGNGSWRWFLDNATVLVTTDGPEILGVMMDITDRKASEEALRDSEEQFRSIFEGALYGIVMADPQGRFITANRAFLDMVGYTREEFLTLDVEGFTHPADRDVTRRNMTSLIEGRASGYTLEKRYLGKDGRAVWVRVSVSMVRDAHQQPLHFVAVVTDLSREKALEEQVRQAVKMEALGRLAGGVAHDFNNILTAILGYSQLAVEDLPKGSAVREYVEEIARAGERAKSVTSQLLAFSRKQIVEIADIHLNGVISGMEKMIRRIAPESVRIETRLAADLPTIRADSGQVEQIVLNLAVNSCDAMPSGGTLQVSTRLTSEGLPPGAPPGRYVELTVSDTGSGMDPDTLRHLFEPFFTTKPRGRGTGLGLSTVYGIVQQHNAYISVDSAPGRGTTFRIHFPTDTRAPAPRPKAADEKTALRGTETVLVVEDDPAVRRLTTACLRSQGYAILAAESGPQAIDLAGDAARVDAAIVDVGLPDMPGTDVAQRLRERWPELKIVFVSGYRSEDIPANGPFLAKPFTAPELAKTMRAVLDGVKSAQ